MGNIIDLKCKKCKLYHGKKPCASALSRVITHLSSLALSHNEDEKARKEREKKLAEFERMLEEERKAA